MKEKLPEKFISMIKNLLGEEGEDLIKSLDEDPVVAIRKNSRKPYEAFDEEESVPWCASGVYLSSRPDFIFDPLLHAGAYYVQDASSMIYQTVIERLLAEFEKISPKVNLEVIDLCAAPGGKTTAMINALSDGSHITANEFSTKRFNILKENLTKWGFKNTSVTNRNTSFFANQGPGYDIVAVDAPCSGEGMMRKDEFARIQWSPELIDECSVLQKKILKDAVEILKPGGFLIYSTCTFNRHENEENVEFLVNELDLMPYDVMFPAYWNIPSGINTNLPVYRFMPHKTKGEGLFLAVLQKKGEGVPSIRYDIEPKKIIKSRHKKEDDKKIKDEYPPIEEILLADKDFTGLPGVELSKEEALKYLRRESLILSENSPKGYIIARYKGLNLGLMKNIGNRANNLYPKNWRILKR